MFCGACGSQEPEDTQFCGRCGTPIRSDLEGYRDPESPSRTVGTRWSPSRRMVRRTLVSSVALVVIVVGIVIANMALSSHFSPTQSALSFVTAEGRGDATAVLRDLIVPANDGRYSAILLNKEVVSRELRADSERGLKRPTVTALHTASNSMTATATVSYTVNGSPHSTSLSLRVAPGKREFLFYRSWKVVPNFAVLSVSMPAATNGVVIDGYRVRLSDGTASVAMLPGTVSVSMPQTALLQAQRRVIEVSSGQNSLALTPLLQPEPVVEAKAALDRAFASCVASTSLHPVGCPFSAKTQSSGDAASVVTWYAFATPSAAAKVSLNSTATAIDFSGTIPMTVSFIDTSASAAAPITDQVTSHYCAAAAPSTTGFSVAFTVATKDSEGKFVCSDE
jgi:hypothetical protein